MLTNSKLANLLTVLGEFAHLMYIVIFPDNYFVLQQSLWLSACQYSNEAGPPTGKAVAAVYWKHSQGKQKDIKSRTKTYNPLPA